MLGAGEDVLTGAPLGPVLGNVTRAVPELLCPCLGSLFPKRNLASIESTLREGGSRLLRAYGSFLSPCGQADLLWEGVIAPLPVGVVAPDAMGLWSLEGGMESPAGPMEKRGVCFGWAETAISSEERGAEVGGSFD